MPTWLQPYVVLDVAAFARDLELAGDIWTTAAGEGSDVEIFDETG